MLYKTYSRPEFSNAHRVVLVQPESGVKELAVGMGVENVEEAEKAAKEEMMETLLSSFPVLSLSGYSLRLAGIITEIIY
jgi:hypothetical protein